MYRTTIEENKVHIEESLETIEESTLFNLTETTLSPQQKALVLEFLQRNSQVIGRGESDLGLSATIEHDFDTQGAAPIEQRYQYFEPPL